MSVWSGIKKIIGGAAPVLGTVLGGPFGAAAGALVADALGVDATPAAVERVLQQDPHALAKVAAMEAEKRGELEKLLVQAAVVEASEYHHTRRTEITSTDKFVSRWRPFFGWIVALCFGAQFMLYLVAGAYAVLWQPDTIGTTFDGLAKLTGATTVIWGIAFSVLGLNITQRSRDKQIAAGHVPPRGLMDGLAEAFSSKGRT